MSGEERVKLALSRLVKDLNRIAACPSEDELIDLVHGSDGWEPDRLEQVSRHVRACAACRAAFRAVVRPLLERVRAEISLLRYSVPEELRRESMGMAASTRPVTATLRYSGGLLDYCRAFALDDSIHVSLETRVALLDGARLDVWVGGAQLPTRLIFMRSASEPGRLVAELELPSEDIANLPGRVGWEVELRLRDPLEGWLEVVDEKS